MLISRKEMLENQLTELEDLLVINRYHRLGHTRKDVVKAYTNRIINLKEDIKRIRELINEIN